jgi:hypothetical protein
VGTSNGVDSSRDVPFRKRDEQRQAGGSFRSSSPPRGYGAGTHGSTVVGVGRRAGPLRQRIERAQDRAKAVDAALARGLPLDSAKLVAFSHGLVLTEAATQSVGFSIGQ